MHATVVVFPGSNSDVELIHTLRDIVGMTTAVAWHKDDHLPGPTDLVAIPGGFAHGDYLRCGAIAKVSPIMADIRRHAERGGYVLGVCNGFQILCESGLLPGVLMRNARLKFICHDVHLRVERSDTPFTRGYNAGQVIRVPIAHGEGNYEADEETLTRLEGEGRVLYRYCSAEGVVDERSNINGAAQSIAGILNERGNVLGMMPHPENHVEDIMGCTDGRGLFAGLVAHLERAA
jgi:phosphoribosylformylglycinamidine synthase